MKQKIPKSSATVKFHINHDQGSHNQSNPFCNNNANANTAHNCCSIYKIKIASNLNYFTNSLGSTTYSKLIGSYLIPDKKLQFGFKMKDTFKMLLFQLCTSC